MENKEIAAQTNPDFVEEHETTDYFEKGLLEYKELTRKQHLRGLSYEEARKRVKLSSDLHMLPEPILASPTRLARLRTPSFIPGLLAPTKTIR